MNMAHIQKSGTLWASMGVKITNIASADQGKNGGVSNCKQRMQIRVEGGYQFEVNTITMVRESNWTIKSGGYAQFTWTAKQKHNTTELIHIDKTHGDAKISWGESANSVSSTLYSQFFGYNDAQKDFPEIKISVTMTMYTTQTGMTTTTTASSAYRIVYVVTATSVIPGVYVTAHQGTLLPVVSSSNLFTECTKTNCGVTYNRTTAPSAPITGTYALTANFCGASTPPAVEIDVTASWNTIFNTIETTWPCL